MNPTMLYKCPGPHQIHGGQFDYTVVEEEDVAQAQADGWNLTTPGAKQDFEDRKAAAQAAAELQAEKDAQAVLADETKPPTREELEQMATKLGLPFGPRTSDKKLRELVTAAAQTPDEG
jgi:hypothetical protein